MQKISRFLLCHNSPPEPEGQEPNLFYYPMKNNSAEL